MKKEIKGLSSYARSYLNIKIPRTHAHMLGVEVSKTKNGLLYRQSFTEFICDDDISCQIIEKAVLMVGYGSHSYFHFPMEYISQLFHIRKYDISNFKFVLENGRNNDWQIMWIKLFFPNVDDSDIIIIRRKPLFLRYAVLIGRTFGLQIFLDRIPDEIKWMNQSIIKNLDLNNNNANKLILIKRNYSRTLDNWLQLKNICEKYCKKFNLELDVFDDAQELGTLREQLIRFNSAKIIVGGHGAGFTNLIGCHQTEFFIEICNPTRAKVDTTKGDTVAYEVMAKTLKINYHKIISENDEVKIHEIEKVLSSLKDNE